MTPNVPLYQAKAELFGTLGHPVRIRVLELLQDGPRAVRELLDDIGVESSSLSQQLAVLRRAGLVSSSRDGRAVVYTLATPDVAQLLLYGRRILASMCVRSGGSARRAPRIGQDRVSARRAWRPSISCGRRRISSSSCCRAADLAAGRESPAGPDRRRGVASLPCPGAGVRCGLRAGRTGRTRPRPWSPGSSRPCSADRTYRCRDRPGP